MKKLLLSTALCVLCAPAFAKDCTILAPVGNLQPVQCSSDSQDINDDEDDLKLFVDKQSGLGNIVGSLNKNTSVPENQNISISVGSGELSTITQEANGFADLKSSNQGDSVNNDLRTLNFAPIIPSDVVDLFDFYGFDGFYARGQVDPTGALPGGGFFWDGDVFEDITFTDGTSLTLTFLGDTSKDDIGSVGFDEIRDPGKLISQVAFRLDNTGAWNEVKQIEFSAVPEPGTWAMLLTGFGLMGWYGLRRRATPRASA